MAHDAVDTCIRSRKLNGVSATGCDNTEQTNTKSNSVGNGASSSILSPNARSSGSTTEVKNATENGIQSNTNNNYPNCGNAEETCNGKPNATTAVDTTNNRNNSSSYRLSCMRGPLHDGVPFIPNFRWPDLIVQIFLHVGALYGLVFQFYSIRFYTLIWCKLQFICWFFTSHHHHRIKLWTEQIKTI